MEPTETPTITPRPTWDWVTPTPMTIPTQRPGFEIEVDTQQFFTDFAEYGVNMYQTTNANGGIDGIMWILIVAIVLLAMRDLYKRIKSL